MLTLKIKIKSHDRTYTESHFLDDQYIVSKQNEELTALVGKACKNSHIDDIQDVIVTSKVEW